MWASSTTTTSSTNSRSKGQVIRPTVARSPSASVFGASHGVLAPRRKESAASARPKSPSSPGSVLSSSALVPRGSAPITCMLGLMALAATAMPESRPPPEMGATITSRCGTCASISTATVPWPAMTRGSSNGATNSTGFPALAWFSSTWRADSSLAFMFDSQRTTFAPFFTAARTLQVGAPCGITTSASSPITEAAQATAEAWFPLLWATTTAGTSARFLSNALPATALSPSAIVGECSCVRRAAARHSS
mmetsp:Transcript_11152/g.68697  ORF Transcript_11152/g.68697 Transcript_11152/m.68697 type:complete len:250 (-) Transcript_11152:3967-4716(-)